MYNSSPGLGLKSESNPVFLGLGLGLASNRLGLDTSGLERGCFLPK